MDLLVMELIAGRFYPLHIYTSMHIIAVVQKAGAADYCPVVLRVSALVPVVSYPPDVLLSMFAAGITRCFLLFYSLARVVREENEFVA